VPITRWVKDTDSQKKKGGGGRAFGGNCHLGEKQRRIGQGFRKKRGDSVMFGKAREGHTKKRVAKRTGQKKKTGLPPLLGGKRSGGEGPFR